MAKIKILFIVAFSSISFFSASQNYNYAFLVEFTNKSHSIYSAEKPNEFLSERSIKRREKHNIEITEQDFPVNKWYLDSIVNFNAKLHVSSRWFNSAVFYTNSAAFVTDVKQVTFVKNVKLVYKHITNKAGKISKWEHNEGVDYYGNAYNQISMCNAQLMHEAGYKGEGIHIAVMDAGFLKVNETEHFDSLRANGQILSCWDFAEGKENVFDSHSHGLMVLSTLAANKPGELIGTAPNASYRLYRTEDGTSEFPIEEENWIAAAEKADSAGVDIITTSLGYSAYDLPELSYEYQNMDGKTTRISRGSEIAFSKGMLLVTSAGNEGNDPWLHITAPSDAENVLCVGAVDPYESIAAFSGRGPSADGRLKPDVVAQGALASVVNTDGMVVERNGTSFSCPIMAGMIACLWQALPEYSNKQILNLVKTYGNRYSNPDYTYGNGLPDFSKLFFTLDSIDFEKPNENKIVNAYPIPVTDDFKMLLFIKQEQEVQIFIQNIQGKTIQKNEFKYKAGSLNLVELPNVSNLTNGYYILSVVTNEGILTKKILKN